MSNYTLGISCFYHDSSATILQGTKILGAIQEERLTRVKNDDSFPHNAIETLLKQFEIAPEQIKSVVYYEKPFLTFERLLETYHAYAPRGFFSFLKVMPIWIKDKIFIKRNIQLALQELNFDKPTIYFSEHHLSHAACAYYPSPFKEAAILTIDGVGEWATTAIWKGKDHQIEQLEQIDFPHSLGLFYSSFTYYCGFKVNDGEYKLMGLAPYAKIYEKEVQELVSIIKDKLITIKDDGSFILNMDYFRFATDLKMVDENQWFELFKITKRASEAKLEDGHKKLALACQKVTEEVILKLATHAKKITNSDYLCLSGGVALNCVANGLLSKKKLFKDIWIQPASGDAGSSLGAALAFVHLGQNEPVNKDQNKDQMNNSFLGQSYSQHHIDFEIKKLENNSSLTIKKYSEELLYDVVAKNLNEQKIIGWFQGRMEFGPRALGGRSILADPRGVDTQNRVNLKIKFRESFRPFAPAVLQEDSGKYFADQKLSSYMQFVGQVNSDVNLPAITHVDDSARIQLVDPSNERFYQLLLAFKKLTGLSVLLNTSFNIRGEPIVCTPEDAINCFFKTHMDILVLGNTIISKNT